MRLVVALFAIVIIVAMLPVTMSLATEESGTFVTQTNETFTPSAGSVTTLNESTRNDVYYNQTVTVYNSSDVQMSEPGDYQWFEGNGTLKTTTGGDLDGEPSGNVTYGYLDTTSTRVTLTALFGQVPTTLGLALPVLVVLLFIRALVGGL